MACICQARLNSETGNWHSEQCDRYNARLERERENWEKQDHQCSGPGYSHPPHGKCSGYSTDRT